MQADKMHKSLLLSAKMFVWKILLLALRVREIKAVNLHSEQPPFEDRKEDCDRDL